MRPRADGVVAATGEQELEHLKSCLAPNWLGSEYSGQRDHDDQTHVENCRNQHRQDVAREERELGGHQVSVSFVLGVRVQDTAKELLQGFFI
jgi:hypothetical protein